MKFLHVINSLDPRHGGTVEATLRICYSMKRAGHHVTIVTADEQSEAFLRGHDVPVYGLGPRLGQYFGFTFKLVPWLNKEISKYDGVIVHGIWDYLSVAVRLASYRSKTPYVVFPHGMMDPWFRHKYPMKHAKKQIYWWLFAGPVLRDAKFTLFTNHEEQELARLSFHGHAKRSERVVLLGTDEPPDNIDEQISTFEAEIPILKGKRFALFLSRIHEKKGCDILIQAFAESSAYKDMHLVIAGPGSSVYVTKLRSLADDLGVSDRIHWPGMLQGNAKWGAYRCAEVFVLPSHQENFGIVLAESLSCGTPVLTTNKVNIWKELQGSHAGLIKSDDVPGIRALLEEWMALDDYHRSTMSRQARSTFAELFQIDNAMKNVVDALSETPLASVSPV